MKHENAFALQAMLNFMILVSAVFIVPDILEDWVISQRHIASIVFMILSFINMVISMLTSINISTEISEHKEKIEKEVNEKAEAIVEEMSIPIKEIIESMKKEMDAIILQMAESEKDLILKQFQLTHGIDETEIEELVEHLMGMMEGEK